MITEITIKTMSELQELVFQQERNDEVHRLRNDYFYRGLSRADYKLETTLTRNCGIKEKELEPFLLRNFAKYASILDPSVNDSEWKSMIVGQHHGLPTRLLDWTISVPMALHFAVSESSLSDIGKYDCAVWRYDAKEINELLPKKYKNALKSVIFTVKELEELVKGVEEYDSDMGSNAFITIEPPSIDHRIVNQYSFFTIMPLEINNLEEFLDNNTKNTVKYIIDKNLRWDIRDLLDQWNISERTVFPGLDGLSKWLKRYYYVK